MYLNVFADADIHIDVVIFRGGKFPCRQIGKQDRKRFVALDIGVLTDCCTDQAAFYKFAGGIYHIVGDNGHIVSPAGRKDSAAPAVNTGSREVQGIHFRMCLKKLQGQGVAFLVIVVVHDRTDHRNIQVGAKDAPESGNTFRMT